MPDNEVHSFGRFLRRFALAVDVVDESTFHEVGGLALKYVKEGLEIEFFEVLTELTIDGAPGLATLWTSEERNSAFRLHDGDGRPATQTASAVLGGTPHWIVPDDEATLLDECEGYRDLWSKCKDLPEYSRPTDKVDAKTSIVVPLQRQGRTVGAMCLESPSYLECTDMAREEIEVLAEALTILYRGQEWRHDESQATRRAVGELSDMLSKVPFPSATRPQLFLASSATADTEVLSCIQAVLRELDTRIRVVHWPDPDHRDVFIGRQLLDRIKKAKFGICYLSEPVTGADGKRSEFRDNPNVLFEAGMLHFMTDEQNPGGWIPIREPNSPETPIDLGDLLRIEVPRSADGRLNTEDFQTQVRGRLHALLGPET